MPNRSACAFDSTVSPPVRNQIAIEPIMDANARKKQSVGRFLDTGEFIKYLLQEKSKWKLLRSTSLRTLGLFEIEEP